MFVNGLGTVAGMGVADSGTMAFVCSDVGLVADGDTDWPWISIGLPGLLEPLVGLEVPEEETLGGLLSAA
jgi:hypothetical protein